MMAEFYVKQKIRFIVEFVGIKKYFNAINVNRISLFNLF